MGFDYAHDAVAAGKESYQGQIKQCSTKLYAQINFGSGLSRDQKSEKIAQDKKEIPNLLEKEKVGCFQKLVTEKYHQKNILTKKDKEGSHQSHRDYQGKYPRM